MPIKTKVDKIIRSKINKNNRSELLKMIKYLIKNVSNKRTA